MKLIFFIGLGCFCFNQMILTSTHEIEIENIPGEIFNSNELCSRMDGKTQFMDLNVDCQLLILKQLDFISLLSLAETNHHLKSLVSLLLKQMFQKKLVDIVSGWPYTQVLLKKFGHIILFEKLKIRCVYPEPSTVSYRSIYKLVNLHCSKTLKEITLEKSMNNLLGEFTNQFENVEEVFIVDALETDRRLNEVFPSVRRLHFHIYEFLSTDSINVKYTNLEHLKIFVNEGPLTEELATELIKKNSHIRSLALDSASVELIKITADLLPQLEGLKLEEIGCEDFNELISFVNVKIFEIERCNINSLLPNIKFGNIEEFHTDALAEIMFGETGFFASNTKLKKLQLAKKYYDIHLNTDVFKQLAQGNSTLQDIFISNASGVEVEPILQLIENNKQLEKLKIIFSFDDDCEFTSEALSGKIGNKWYMKAFSNTIILKKKHIWF